MTTAPIALIFGAGANVGASVARAFAAKGYKIAVTSRQPHKDHDEGDYLRVQSDLEDPNSVEQVFDTVRKTLGHPSVVVYNASKLTANPPDDPMALSVPDMLKDFSVMTSSALVAARQAVIGFGQLPSTAANTFIYTGNRLNIAPIGPLLSAGIGKSAAAHIVASAAQAYKAKGFKFYYADERKPDGAPAYQISGEAHGEYYVQLAEQKPAGPWLATFVKGKGYVDFGFAP